MGFLLYIIIIILVIYIIIDLFSKKKPEKDRAQICNTFPYAPKNLLTKAEYSFYNVLKVKCDNNNLLICPKVRMEDFISVTDKQNYMKYRGYIKSRHIDFILCDNKLHIIAGIELDDNSHNQPKAKNTDEFKNQVFAKIGLPLYRVKISDGMYETKIENILNNLSHKSK